MSENLKNSQNFNNSDSCCNKNSKPYATVDYAATSLANKTGSWRTMCPQYIHRLPPCNATCPAGENIQGWLSKVQEGNFQEAWNIMVENNPFPAVMGRVCYHTCEQVCNRSQFDGAVHINLIERLVGDEALKNNWKFKALEKSINKKILIIGAGPSGLSAAYFLRKLGYEVTIYEAMIKAGGMLRYGVPRYRLSREVLDTEIERIIDMGVKIICNKKVSRLKDEISGFDAVYISTGASLATEASIEIKGNSCTTIDAIDLFRRLEDNMSIPDLGKRVVVYGGGNTAIDAARTARRLGIESVKIVYRRTISKMPAHKEEVQEALKEGIEVLYLSSIGVIDGNKILLNKMDYDEQNDILSVTGEKEIIEADSVIFAIGQSINTEILEGMDEIVSKKGLIEIDKNMMTGAKGIFAGGDVVPCKRTVTHAIGCGKKAAKCIDAFLNGYEVVPNMKPEVANYKKLNTAYFKKNPRSELDTSDGILSFSENAISLNKEEVVAEASRCFSCGNCFHCDNCYGFCPDGAIHKSEDGTLTIDYEYCKGCGICASECPCGAIKMSS